MPETFNSYAAFIEDFVLPLRRENPKWRALNGDAGSSRKCAAYLHHDGQRFRVHEDSHIESLLTPYYHMRERKPGVALIVGPTRTAKRQKLKPGPGAGIEVGFYIYLD